MESLLPLLPKLLNLTPEVLLGLAVVAVCYALKLSRFPNRWIPWVCLTLPAVLYPLLVIPGEAEGVRSPVLRCVLIGILIGLLTWAFHAQILKRILDPHWFGEEKPPAPPK